MEHKFYTDDFERLLKEKSDEFRMYPSKRVWHSIYNDLHPDRKWPSIAVTLLLVAALFLIGYWNNSNTASGNLATGTKQHNAGTVTAQNFTNKSTDNNAVSLNGNGNTAVNNTTAANTISSSVNTVKENVPNKPANNFLQPNIYNQQTAATSSGTHVTSTVTRQKYLPAGAAFFNSKNTNNKVSNSAIAEAFSAVTQIITNNEFNSSAVKPVQSNTLFSNTVTEQWAAGNEGLKISGNTTTASSLKNEDAQPLSTTTVATQKTNNNSSQLSAQDKSWIEHYALYNKTARKKWKGRLSSEIYVTPGLSMRSFYSNTPVKISAAPSAVNIPGTTTNMPSYNPGFTFQAGAGLSYAAAKNIRVKAGIQASFTSYSIPVTDINHPVFTTLTFNNLNSGYPYLEGRASTIANVPGHNNKKIHNQTSQISIPIGLAVKLGGNDKLQWYAGGSVQPTLVLGGKAYLLSSDNNNFVSDPSLLRTLNVNGAAETFMHYKMNGFTLQAGPEFRYQFTSTYLKKYANTEKLYNIGFKVGIIKNL